MEFFYFSSFKLGNDGSTGVHGRMGENRNLTNIISGNQKFIIQ